MDCFCKGVSVDQHANSADLPARPRAGDDRQAAAEMDFSQVESRIVALAELRRLVERLVGDQRCCWQAGRPRKVEEYLAEHPALAASEEALLDFIRAELSLREEFGETVAAGEYQDRFPNLKIGLARLFDVHAGQSAALNLLAGEGAEVAAVVADTSHPREASGGAVPQGAEPAAPCPAIAGQIERLRQVRSLLGVNRPEGPAAVRDSDLLAADATRDFLGADRSKSRTGPHGENGDRPSDPWFPPPPVAPGEKIGRYRVERDLGSGSFGTVYLAADDQLQRSVAVKILRPDRLAGDAEQRFLVEARTVARLKHPLIVPVFDVGRHADGRPYAVMEFVEGQSLKASLAAARPSPARAAELIATIAEAIDHAHRRGFVHRDLKPANILLDPAGTPHVLDFGLAIHESSQRAHAGEMAGTLPYMAPEQVRREAQRLDGRADLWALGVMLYEMLTGRRPFDGPDFQGLSDEILHRDPKPPRQIDDAIPAELERICLKCLHKDVSQRYLAARDLARDLRRAVKPRQSGRPWFWVTAAVGGMLFAVAAWWVGSNGLGKLDPKPVPLHGKIDIRVWKSDDPACQDTSVADVKARPLRAGDRFSIQTELSRPAYLYVLDIDGQGQVTPLYPWQPGKWHTLPVRQKPVERVGLPEGDRLGKIKPPGGMETLLLLARETPLTDDAELLALLPEIPPQPIGDKGAIFVLTNGERESLVDVAVSGGGTTTRTYDVSDAAQNDATLRTLHTLHERLAPQFPLVRTVTVANRGE